MWKSERERIPQEICCWVLLFLWPLKLQQKHHTHTPKLLHLVTNPAATPQAFQNVASQQQKQREKSLGFQISEKICIYLIYPHKYQYIHEKKNECHIFTSKLRWLGNAAPWRINRWRSTGVPSRLAKRASHLTTKNQAFLWRCCKAKKLKSETKLKKTKKERQKIDAVFLYFSALTSSMVSLAFTSAHRAHQAMGHMGDGNGDGNEASNCKTISEGVRTKRSKGLGKRSKDCHTIPNQMCPKIKTQTWIMKQIVWRIEAWTNGHHPYWTLTISNRPLERTSLPWRDMERPLSSWHSYESNEIEKERYVKSTKKYPVRYVKHKL